MTNEQKNLTKDKQKGSLFGKVSASAAHLARQMAIISQVGSQVIALLDADIVLPEVVSRVQRGMNYRRMAVILADEDSLTVGAQSPPLLAKDVQVWQEPFVRRVVDAVEPLSFAAGESHSSGVVVPLRMQERVLGGLVVEFGSDQQTETTELFFLMTVASLVAMAVENIRLFQMALQQSRYLDQRAARLSRMLDASNHLLRVGPYDDGLFLAVARLAHDSLGFRLSAVSRLDSNSQQLMTQLLVGMVPDTPPEVRLVSGHQHALSPLMDPKFRVSRSYRLDGTQIEPSGKEGEASFHLPEVLAGKGPWHPQKALLIPFQERDGRITGVLTLDYPRNDRLPSLETVQTAEIFANQAAIALDNARLFEELQRRLRETNTLFAMGQQMVTTLDRRQVLEAIAQAALSLVSSASKVVIHLVDESNYLVPRVVRPPKKDGASPAGMMAGEGIAGLAAVQNRALYVPAASRDKRFVGLAADFSSLLVVPISAGDRVIGTLSVDSPRFDIFRPDDERVLMIIANQAAIALENARLYAEAKRVDELAAMNSLTSRLSSSLDRILLLHIAAQEIARILKSEAVAVVMQSGGDKRSAPRIVFCGSKSSMEKGEPSIIETRELALHSSERDLHEELAALGITVRQSLQAVISAHDHVLGYVEVYNLPDGASMDESLTLLNSMATAVAMTLENARLYEEVRDSAEELASSQAQLVQSAKLAATGRLAASIAHEINNPLQAVQSCVYLLSDSITMDDSNRPYLDTALEELSRMARIVERMVDFYRPAKEGSEPTDANQLLMGVLTLAHKRMQQADIELYTNLDPGLPKIVVIADHIKQVFLNIVLNALDAMPNGGKLTISSRLLAASGRASSSPVAIEWVEFEFSDTGIGIEAEALPHIFDPFFTSKSQGSGLGLSISYGIVERHGGRIRVASVVRQGTTFTVCLPVSFNREKRLEAKL